MTSCSLEPMSRQALGELLGLTPRAVANLEHRGLPVDKSGRHPRYMAPACVSWYVQAKVTEALKRRAPADLDAERTRKVAADASLRELDLREREGELILVEDAVVEVDRMLDLLRSRLLNFPGRWGLRMVGIRTPAESIALLSDGIRELMECLSGAPIAAEAVTPEESDAA